MQRCRGGRIRVCDLPKDVLSGPSGSGYPTLKEIVAGAQRTAIENTLNQTGGSVAEAAKLLGVDKGHLYRLMDKLGMVRK